MVLQIITILALLTSNAVMCMDNNNNNLKEEQSYGSEDEVKINTKITDEENEKHLKPKKRASLPNNFEPYMVAKKHFKEFYSSDEDSKLTAAITTGINNLSMKQEENTEQSFTPEELKKELKDKVSPISVSRKTQEAAQKFKDLTTSKYAGISRAKKTPSQASTDFIKIEENGMENDGQ